MHAAPPQQFKSQEKLIYTVGTVDMVVSLWKKAPRNFQEERLLVSQRWFESSRIPEPDVDMNVEQPQETVEPDSATKPAATQLDAPEDSPKDAQGVVKRKQDSPAKPTKRAPIGSAPGDLRSSPVKPPPKKARETVASDTGPAGVKLWDLGGDGQCGLRMLAGLVAFRNGKTREQIADKASQLSISLRAKVAAFLAKDTSFQQTWFADLGATVDTEAGNPATTWQEYVETVKRPHKWTDSWMIQAAAIILKTDIHVFKWCRRYPKDPEEWVYLDVCRPNHKSKAPPIVLCLRDGHFTGVDPEAVCPVDLFEDEPLSQQVEKSDSIYRGSGKSTSACSSWLATPKSRAEKSKVVKDDDSLASWLKPAESAKSVKTKQINLSKKGSLPRKDTMSASSSWLKPPSSLPREAKQSPKGAPASSCSSSASRSGAVLEQLCSTWLCPVCKINFTAKGSCTTQANAKLSAMRTNHIQSHHKDNKEAFGPHTHIRKRVVIPEMSASIPMDQRDWSCPMPRCKMGLGVACTRWAKEQAIEKHRKTFHPQVTRTELYHKRWKQWKSPKQISLQKSRVQLAITRRTNTLAGKDLNPLGHSLKHFTPDWSSWIFLRGGCKLKKHFLTCVNCLQVSRQTWRRKCKGSKGGIRPAQRVLWHNLSDENQKRLVQIWGITLPEANDRFASPQDSLEEFGHELVHFTPKPSVWPSSQQGRVAKFTTCKRCWRFNPYGNAICWKTPCNHDSERAGSGQVRIWKSLRLAQKRILCRVWGVSISVVNEWMKPLQRS